MKFYFYIIVSHVVLFSYCIPGPPVQTTQPMIYDIVAPEGCIIA